MNVVVTLCLLGGGVFLVSFAASTIIGIVQHKRESSSADDENNE